MNPAQWITRDSTPTQSEDGSLSRGVQGCPGLPQSHGQCKPHEINGLQGCPGVQGFFTIECRREREREGSRGSGATTTGQAKPGNSPGHLDRALNQAADNGLAAGGSPGQSRTVLDSNLNPSNCNGLATADPENDSWTVLDSARFSPGRPVRTEFVPTLASWDKLHPGWWKDDQFALTAAALGFDGPPPPPPSTAADPVREQAAWEQVAKDILARDFTAAPADRSTIEALDIGLRAFPRSAACRSARGKLETITPARWRKTDIQAGTLLPR